LWKSFPQLRRPSVKVTAYWGWAATPDDVVEAVYLMANRLFYENDVPSGVVPGGLDFPGAPLQRMHTAERLLRPYIRASTAVGIAG
jgi:hypothetical protein